MKKKLDSRKDTKTKKKKINHPLKDKKTKKEKINHPSMKQNISWKSKIFFLFLILILTSPFILIAIKIYNKNM
ncbi:hypothetical protein RS022_08930 [Candidatus Phytoplasma rubi]|uniref:Uncharacterized protein n=1 Tax=Candidatus Phytoplasma rubi TaxID=399025 RepID=A0ABY7BV92_9MOLU|nr:hypothetical protein [Candidatus Phytoplasma rubi]WAN63680.1 hypothetical protein RS022_08930 [Candidatus Phytoplasma rubi]